MKKKIQVKLHSRRTKTGGYKIVKSYWRKKAKRLFGKRRGQTLGKGFPAGHYVTAGKLHRISSSRDRVRKAKHIRKHGSPTWRGDVKGSNL